MKKILFIIALTLLTVSTFAQDGRSIYNRYSDLETVEAVYISPAMFRLIGRIPDLNVENEDGTKTDLSPLIQSLTGFYLVSTSDASVKERLDKDVQAFMDKGHYELLMEAKDHGEKTRIYTVGDEKFVTSLVMIALDGDETSFICLDGKIRQSDIDKLAEKVR